MNMSFFGRPPYWGTNNHAHRISTYIRGIQIAEHLGARFNPEDNYNDDVCVYIKPRRNYQPIEQVKIGGARKYLDIVDDVEQLKLLDLYDMTTIVCSKNDFVTVKDMLLPGSKLFCIPQQHCNFERIRRNRNTITTVGMLGGHLEAPRGLREALDERGMNLVECTDFFTRQDTVNFYSNIDIHIVWRPWIVNNRLSNPLKIVNASSFGVPTIALYEDTFREVNRSFISVRSLWDLLYYIDTLRWSTDLYSEYAEIGIEISEPYHIDNIGKMYEQLQS